MRSPRSVLAGFLDWVGDLAYGLADHFIDDRIAPPKIQVIPRQLAMPGRIMSDTIVMQLNAIRSCHGAVHADDLAAGYVDAAARYWQAHEDDADLLAPYAE